MSKIDIEFKDRIVEFPNRYSLTDNGDGTKTLTPFPGEVTEEGTPVNAANLNEIVEKHNGLDDMVDSMRQTSSGYVTYTDEISAGGTSTKTITIPEGVRRGIATIGDVSNNLLYSVLIHFTIDNQEGKLFGNSSTLSGFTSRAWCVRQTGTVTDDSHGPRATGNTDIYIRQFYIDKPNNVIKIVFENIEATSRSLNCRIDWEVF